MSTELRVKFLQYVVKKNNSQGFTFFEILIVIFILGGLVAIASVLPNFLHPGNKAVQAEAKQYVGSMNRGQQAYYVENGKFVTKSDPESWNSLGIGIRTQTTNYTYSISGNKKAVFNYGILREDAPNQTKKSYVGGVFEISDISLSEEKTTVAIICETKSPTTTKPAEPILRDDVITCGEDTIPITDLQSLILASDYAEGLTEAQEKHYAQKGSFTNSLPALGFKIKAQTEFYQYSVNSSANAAFHYAKSRHPKYPSYVGGVFLVPNSNQGKAKTVSIFCQTISPGNQQAANPTYKNNVLRCGANTKQLSTYNEYQYLESINQSQKSYYSQHRKFANSIQQLGSGVIETNLYKYSLVTTPTATFSYAIAKVNSSTNTNYVGGVFVVPGTAKNQTKTVAIVCRDYYSSEKLPASPIYKNGILACGDRTTEVSRNSP
ncbi:MAG TPA: type IV pilin-like G/H family protein [Leptolyngbyaceae cyanobacterium]